MPCYDQKLLVQKWLPVCNIYLPFFTIVRPILHSHELGYPLLGPGGNVFL